MVAQGRSVVLCLQLPRSRLPHFACGTSASEGASQHASWNLRKVLGGDPPGIDSSASKRGGLTLPGAGE